MQKNPYAADLADRDALTALAETPQQIAALAAKWTAAQWNQPYAPGKWTARQVLVHLFQTELALTTRVRFAASRDGYVAQPFSQDDWMPLDDKADGATALDAYLALRRMTVAMFRHMTTAQRTRMFKHPEYGDLTPDWVAAQLAGHDLHHLAQLGRIANP
jgi:hypothetical protein